MAMKVLVVDDDSTMRFLLKLHIKNSFSQALCAEASDGMSAVSKARAFRPDIVFLDIKMPGLDGISALKQIREVSPLSHVVMCSGETEERYKDASFENGAEGYILKPFSESIVVEHLMRFA